MKQILQSLKTGQTQVAEIPVPQVTRRQVLISTSRTLVSAGTERMLLEFGKAGWIEKARQQPDKVRMVLEKIKTDGLQPTIEAVLEKLDQPLPMGYCNVGKVLDTGREAGAFQVGDRVVSNGKHAEAVSVPMNLCAKVPDVVSDDEAAFTVLGAIALQGIRLANPTLGETVVVTGLGLVGLMTVQLLRAHGCRVLGMDFDKDRLELATRFGAEVVDLSEGTDPVLAAQSYSRDRGVDAVIITVSSKSNEPVSQAAKMCRKRGRIVLVGVTGLELSRADFFEKELTFQVSCSYGPGRYDSNYEEKGNDYPIGFVRWTEQRNFEAVLDMMAEGKLDIKPLISHKLEIEDAQKAYEIVGGLEKSLGILLEYPGIEITQEARTVTLTSSGSNPQQSPPEERNAKVELSFIGSGNYATKTLMPAFKEAGAGLRSVATNTGVGGVHAGRKHGFIESTTDVGRLFSDDQTNAIVIATRHDSHAGFVLEALRSGKHVFVEKPLCLNHQELEEIGKAFSERQEGESDAVLMVGFNRRFSPQVQRMKKLLKGTKDPKAFVMTVNAGEIPADHWTHDPETGGGRIVGEACHFIDLIRFLCGAPIKSFQKMEMDSSTRDTVTLQLGFEDGSVGTIHYFANGSKAYPKERLEVFASGGILQLDNFRKLRGFGWPSFRKMNLWRQEKGQKACARAFVDAVSGGKPSPIGLDEILEVSRVAIDLQGGACS